MACSGRTCDDRQESPEEQAARGVDGVRETGLRGKTGVGRFRNGSRPVSVRVRGLANEAVALITLDEPKVHNAISADVASRLAVELAGADAAEDVRVIVVTGQDPAFCSGMDLRDLAAGRTIPLDFFHVLSTTTKPVIAAINGVAATGGLELALACDVRIASERAVLVDLHTQLGMLPGAGGTVRLGRLIGPSRALEMALSGRRVSADEALRMGLVDRLVPHQTLLDVVTDVAERMALVDRELMSRVLPLYRGACDGTITAALERERGQAVEWRRVRDLTSAHERFRSMRGQRR